MEGIDGDYDIGALIGADRNSNLWMYLDAEDSASITCIYRGIMAVRSAGNTPRPQDSNGHGRDAQCGNRFSLDSISEAGIDRRSVRAIRVLSLRIHKTGMRFPCTASTSTSTPHDMYVDSVLPPN